MSVPDLVTSDYDELVEYLWDMEADLGNIRDNGHVTGSIDDDLNSATENIESAREKLTRRSETEKPNDAK